MPRTTWIEDKLHDDVTDRLIEEYLVEVDKSEEVIDQLKKTAEEHESQIPAFKTKIENIIKASPEYKALLDVYPVALRNRLKLQVTPSCHIASPKFRGPYVSQMLHVEILEAVADPAVNHASEGWGNVAASSSSCDAADEIPSWEDMWEEVWPDFQKVLKSLTSIARAAFYLYTNYQELEARPEFTLLDVDNNKLNWFGYFNPVSQKYYRGKIIKFCTVSNNVPYKFNGFILVNVDDAKDKIASLDDNFKLVCARYNSTTGDIWSIRNASSHDDYYSDSETAKEFGIDVVPASEGSVDDIGHQIKIEGAEKPFSEFFKWKSSYRDSRKW